ncbi:MAG: flavin-nucleotide-binding protein [Peptococcaceae bacterium]|nr:flavin-nucleotide-binding protein [Peptococcaceae bacterium]
MNKMDREITDQEEIKEILRTGKYTTIAMCKNNEPYVVTLNYGYDEANNSLCFHSAPKGLKIDIMEDNPTVCATVIVDKGYIQNKCKHPFSSVVLWGKMEIMETLDDKKLAMDVLITHLEDNPENSKNRLRNDKMYDFINLLRLNITSMRGKSGS